MGKKPDLKEEFLQQATELAVVMRERNKQVDTWSFKDVHGHPPRCDEELQLWIIGLYDKYRNGPRILLEI